MTNTTNTTNLNESARTTNWRIAMLRNALITAIATVTLVFVPSMANAAQVVDPGKIVTGSATGTLVVIDVPFVTTGNYPQSGGPIWTTSPALIAHPADNGFTTQSFGIRERFGGRSPWEPDGTPFAEAFDQGTFPTGSPNVSYNFGTVASGVLIADGSVVNAVYATWTPRGGGDGATYGYSEGGDSNTLAQTHTVAPNGDLVLSWTDDVAVTRNGNFQRLFLGPIVVADGDGFELTAIDNLGNAAHIDAVVIDVTLPSTAIPEPAAATLAMFGLGGLAIRRRNRAA